MKMYLPFGDWSEDGHGKYKNVLIEAPSMQDLLRAQKKIKAKYGDDFFRQMADDYEEPFFGFKIWQALIDTEYPIERLAKVDTCNDWTSYSSLEEALKDDANPYISLDLVIDVFIWLLNSFGALIIRCSRDEYIPQINNWTCEGFEAVGYGCFDF